MYVQSISDKESKKNLVLVKRLDRKCYQVNIQVDLEKWVGFHKAKKRGQGVMGTRNVSTKSED